MSGNVGGRIRVYAIGIGVLAASIIAATAVRAPVEAAPRQEEPVVTVEQESVHVIVTGAVGLRPVRSGSL